MITPEQETELLQSLLGKRPLERFSAEKLAGKAHWRWNRGQLVEAAVLFNAAAVRSAEEVRIAPPLRDNTFNYRVRAGVTFRLAGEYERAWPILLQATSFDWQAAGIPEDDHFTEWAFVEMLSVLAERNDRDGFTKLFWQAVGRCGELDSPFPFIRPKQELLLNLCEKLRLADELAHVIARMEEQRGRLRGQLAQRIAHLKSGILEHDA
jgi:hypothetical protein